MAGKESCQAGKEFWSAKLLYKSASKKFGSATKEFCLAEKEFCRVTKESGQASKEFCRPVQLAYQVATACKQVAQVDNLLFYRGNSVEIRAQMLLNKLGCQLIAGNVPMRVAQSVELLCLRRLGKSRVQVKEVDVHFLQAKREPFIWQ